MSVMMFFTSLHVKQNLVICVPVLDDFLMTLVLMHCFHSVLIKGAVVLILEHRVVEDPPTLWPEILTYGGVSIDVEGHELGKSEF